MRELSRINRISDIINEIWLQHPDLRYHQLIDSLKVQYFKSIGYDTGYKEDWFADWFYFEDSDWEEFLTNFKRFE